MDKKASVGILALMVAMLVFATAVAAAPKKCNNGIDDDNDGLKDYPADPGCSGMSDNDEHAASLICDNGIDATNDRDTLKDYQLSGGDPGCTSPTDNNEIDGMCDDNVDSSDRDTLSDASDPGCTSTSDATETDGVCDDNSDDASDRDALGDATDPGCSSFSDTSEIDGMCDDSTDDASDADSLADGSDSGCSSTSDTTEADGQCDDTINNDLDGLVDYSTDPGCTSYSDSNELGTVQCDDGIDNTDSEDTLADYPADVGCVNALDNDERNQCNDGLDNDGDGHNNYQSGGSNRDSKCSSAADNDESPKDSCSDTDGGISIFTVGNVDGDDESSPYNYADVCLDSTILLERYCGSVSQDYAPLNSTQNCTSNSTGCSNGACQGISQCDDGLDNDGDSLTDYPSDPGCSDPGDTNEHSTVQCDDGADNDGDGKVDFGNTDSRDSKCSSASDNDESPRDSCADTDGGINVFILGNVNGYNEGSTYNFEDVCIDTTLLREYYCAGLGEDYSPLNASQNCSMSNSTDGTCSAGRCV